MNVLALNGSPRGTASNTEILIQAFLSGARDAGAETDTVYLADLEIRHCSGCFSCWTRTPGICIHDDDMPALLERLRRTDVLIIACPLYGNMVTGLMKDCLDRMLPLSHPAMVRSGEQYGHPARYEDGRFRFVVIANAGFPGTRNFDGLKATFEQMDRGPRSALAGMICCSAGPMLSIPGAHDQIQWYLDATARAGREVVEQGRISDETATILARSLAADADGYASTVNAYWQSVGVEMPDRGEPDANAEAHDGMPLEPSGDGATIRNLVAGMPGSFSPDAAGDLQAVLQFDVADEEPGQYFVTIESGCCEAFEGTHPNPTLTVHTTAQVWIDVCTGAVDGAAALMAGQYRVTGDMGLLMRFGSLFSGGEGVAGE